MQKVHLEKRSDEPALDTPTQKIGATPEPCEAAEWPEPPATPQDCPKHFDPSDLLKAALKQLPKAGGEIFGFKLVRELGRGAFGRVFLATQPELAGRIIALKVSADLVGESRALAQLQHTNIVPVYSMHRAGLLQGVCMPYFGSTTMADLLKRYREVNRLPATGREFVETLQNMSQPTNTGSDPSETEPAFVAMPRPEGETDTILKLLSGHCYCRAIAWLGARLAEGLSHAHDRGLLHRDIKPANILLTDYGQPMLLDFGISKDLKQRPTFSGVAGTVPYMAPEHLEELGTGVSRADVRSDIYSLGIVLFELLTGRYPYRLPTENPAEEAPRLIAERKAGSPRLRTWNRAVSPALESIILTCLQPEATRRYQSAAELGEDLDRYLAHQPLKIAPEPSIREQIGNWRRRHPLLTSNAALGLGAVAILAFGGYAYSERRVRIHRLEAERAFLQFETETKSAQYLVNSGAGEPKLLDEGLAKTKAALDRYGVGERDWEQRPGFAALPPEQQIKLREDLADLCMQMARGISQRGGTGPDKEASLHEAIGWNVLAGEISGQSQGAIRAQRARLLRMAGRTEEAEAIAEKVGGETDRWSAAEHTLQGNELLSQSWHVKALVHFRKALRLDPKLFWAHIGEGACHAALGRLADARGSYTAAIALWPDVAWGYYNRGLVGLQLGDAEIALEDLNKAAELAPEFPELYWHRAEAHLSKGQAKDGLKDLEEAVKLGLSETKFLVLRSELNAKAGDADAAKRDLDAALGTEPHDSAGWVERGRARLAADVTAALVDFEKALELEPKSVHALLMKAYVLKQQEKFEGCLAILERAVDAAPENAHARAGRGLLYARFKKWASAEAEAKEALSRDASPQIVYQVAATYARLSEHNPAYLDRAVDLLTIAIKSGIGREFVACDPEFTAIRENAEFRRLVKGE